MVTVLFVGQTWQIAFKIDTIGIQRNAVHYISHSGKVLKMVGFSAPKVSPLQAKPKLERIAESEKPVPFFMAESWLSSSFAGSSFGENPLAVVHPPIAKRRNYRF